MNEMNLFFSHQATGEVREKKDGCHDSHEQENSEVKPEGFDVPVAQTFLAAIERCTPQTVLRGEVDECCSGYNVVIHDVQQTMVVSSRYEVLQLLVKVIPLQLHEGIFTVLTDKLLRDGVLLERPCITTLCKYLLCLFHVAIK